MLLTILRALVHANRLEDAASFYRGDFARTLLFSVEAYHQILALLKPLFPGGFQAPPNGLTDPRLQAYLLNDAGIALQRLRRSWKAQPTHSAALRIDLDGNNGAEAVVSLLNLGLDYSAMNRLGNAVEALCSGSVGNGEGVLPVR